MSAVELQLRAEIDTTSVVRDPDMFSYLLDELGDVGLVVLIARTFLDELPGRVAHIVETNGASVELAAHTLKSASALVGAVELRDVTAEIEQAARVGSLVNNAQIERLRAICAETEVAIETNIAKLEQTP